MPESSLVRRLLLPELHLTNASYAPSSSRSHLQVEKVSSFEVCPRCAQPSRSVYDRRTVVVKDAPLREKHVVLHIKKRRFSCRPCGRPFTEPVPGIKKGARTTQRYKRSLLWACEKFSDLSAVRRAYACSSGFLYKALLRWLPAIRPSIVAFQAPRAPRGLRVQRNASQLLPNSRRAASCSCADDAHRADGAFHTSRDPDAAKNSLEVERGNPRLLLHPPHQRQDRGLQQQSKARETKGLRV